MFSEQDLDPELKAALAVSPRPDFEARVLQRVEADRPSHWRAHYGWLAAAAALVIAAGVVYAMTRTSPPPATQIVRQTAPPAPLSEAPVHQPSIVPPRVETVRAVRTAARTAPRRAEPEVIVPLNQMEAVRRLVRAVNEGGVQPPAEPPQGPMAPPAALGVAPVVIAPIPLSPLGTGGTQK